MQPTASVPVPSHVRTFLNAGFSLIPCHSLTYDLKCDCKQEKCSSPGKHPHVTQGLHAASNDLAQIMAWCQTWPNCNWAAATGGKSGFWALDIDTRGNGHSGLSTMNAWAEAGRVIPDDVIAVSTGGGGTHYYFRFGAECFDLVRNSANKLGPGIDVRGDGGYVVLPGSVHKSGKDYHFVDGRGIEQLKLKDAPAWLLSMFRRTPMDRRAEMRPVPDAILEGGRNSFLASAMGSMRRVIELADPRVMTAAARALNEVRCDPPLEDEELATIVTSVGRYEPAVNAEPIDHLQELGKNYSDVVGLLRSDAGSAGILGGKPCLNEMGMMIGVRGPGGWKPLIDADYSAATERLENIYRTSKGKKQIFGFENVYRAIEQVAAERPFHPVRDWLNSLVWDHIPRINSFHELCLKIPGDPYASELFKRWMLSAVARALRPGCKADNIFILVGNQGIFKSSLFSHLCDVEPGWFSDTSIDIHSKDAFLTLQRCWVMEWPELESMARARDADAVKSFLSSRVDIYRPPYGRVAQAIPRTSVIVGTTNKDEFLTDTTGNRRFWPVRTPGTIYLEWIDKCREFLWAEAVSMFKNGEKWWVEDENNPLLREHQATVETEEDPWSEPMSRYLSDRAFPEISTLQFLEYMNIPADRHDSKITRRVAGILRKRGYVSRQSGPDRLRRWVKVT